MEALSNHAQFSISFSLLFKLFHLAKGKIYDTVQQTVYTLDKAMDLKNNPNDQSTVMGLFDCI